MERQILLNTIDRKWVDYLHNIDLLREGIHLRGYGQRDPLQEYKREAFDMFNRLLKSIKEESIQLIFRAQPVIMDMDDLEGMILNELKNLGQEGDELPDLDQQQFADLVSGIMSGKTPEELGLIGKVTAEEGEEGEELDAEADANLKSVLGHLGEVDAKGEDEAKNGEAKGDDEDDEDQDSPAKKPEVKTKSGSRKSKRS
jgi:preprotein translocase subunit SecA